MIIFSMATISDPTCIILGNWERGSGYIGLVLLVNLRVKISLAFVPVYPESARLCKRAII